VTRLVIDLEPCSNYVDPASFRRPRLLTEDRAYFELHGECNDERSLEIRDERRERSFTSREVCHNMLPLPATRGCEDTRILAAKPRPCARDA
jgi:hypothetical protein